MKLIKLGRLMTRAAAYAPVVVEPGTGEIIYVGQAPSASGVTWYMAPGQGGLTWAGLDPSVSFADLFLIMTPGLGSATWTGLQPGLSMPVIMQPGTASMSWSGAFVPTVDIAFNNRILLETGDALLAENGDTIIQEAA